MPKMALSHFETAIVFAFFTSIVLGVVTKKTDRERVRYGIQTFTYFVVTLFALGWLMYLGHG